MSVAWESNQSYWAAAGFPYIAGIVITPKFTIAQLTQRTLQMCIGASAATAQFDASVEEPAR